MKVLFLILSIASIGFASTLELVVTEEQLQEALEQCIEDTRISSLDVDIQNDLIVLTAVREMPLRTVDLEIQIWLDPEAEEDLWSVKEATANGESFNQNRIELWNEWFNIGMENMAETELGRADVITIEPDQITFIWE
jgi:hypothetical protein